MKVILTAIGIFISAFLEYIFPPYFGDTAMLMGYFMAGRGDIPLWVAIVSSLLGSIAGALSAYFIGFRLGTSYFFLKSKWVTKRVERLHGWYNRFGGKLLIINRFLPGLRGVFLYAAGMGRLRFLEVAIYSTVSNVLWLFLIGYVGLHVGTNWEDVKRAFVAYTRTLGVLFTIIFFMIVARRIYTFIKESKAH